jgi:hypothetical protein
MTECGYLVIRRHRNTGDAHAAGAERSGAPKSVKPETQSVIFPEKPQIDFHVKTGSRSIRLSFSIAIMITIRK